MSLGRSSLLFDPAAAVAGAFVVTLATMAPAAAADPEASVVRPRPPSNEPVAPEPQPPPERERTAADVADAPVPGDESGRVEPEPIEGGDSAARQVARGLLFFPKIVVTGVLAVPRGGVWVFDRYDLMNQYYRVFYNDARTIGLHPTLVVDLSLGVVAGGRFVHKDLFGEREQLTAQAAWGSRFRQIYSAGFRSGDRFGKRLWFELDAAYERRPHDAFYGIGNDDQMTVDPSAPPTPIDPRVDSTSIEARYRQDRARLAALADVRPISHLHLRAAGALSEVEFGPGDQGEPIDARYQTAGLVGWGGARYGYGELAVRWDSRRAVRRVEPAAVYSGGSLAEVHAGRVHRLDDGPDFWRYGADLQHFMRLGDGPRVLAARLHGEAVTGGRDEVPFSELPMLGGPIYLRGYDLDRFRDRVAAFGSLAYQWDLSQWFSASLFVDAGRVYPSLDELSLDDMRVGYGLGLEAHSFENFVAEATIASSIDGGVQLNLAFNRVFDLDERVRRK
jgi:Omp85 superfamily domain